jgi:hypothetical protein
MLEPLQKYAAVSGETDEKVSCNRCYAAIFGGAGISGRCAVAIGSRVRAGPVNGQPGATQGSPLPLASVNANSPSGILSNSHLSIKEITHAIGYEHTSGFVRAFERRFRQAPARYRKQNEGKYETEHAKRIQAA